jgi:hypothetical protein
LPAVVYLGKLPLNPVRTIVLILAAALFCACTVTPSDFPPCVDPNGAPCPLYEAGADADASEAGAADSPHEGADGGDAGMVEEGGGGDAGGEAE